MKTRRNPRRLLSAALIAVAFVAIVIILMSNRDSEDNAEVSTPNKVQVERLTNKRTPNRAPDSGSAVVSTALHAAFTQEVMLPPETNETDQ